VFNPFNRGVLWCRRRVLRHKVHVAVYQSLSVRAVASHYAPSAVTVADNITDTSPADSVVIAVEVENVNTVSEPRCFVTWKKRKVLPEP